MFNKSKSAYIALAGLVILLGVMVQLGWFLGIAKMVQVLPGSAPMQFNTALGFLFSGSIALLYGLGYRRGVFPLSSLLLLLGVASFIQYPTGWELGIDNLLWEHSITDKTSHPGRMAPNTAICFIIVALIYLSLYASVKLSWRSFLLCLLTATLYAISFNTLFGYLFNLELSYGWFEWTRMALHTGIGFFLLSFFITIYIWFEEPVVKQINNVLLACICVYTCMLINVTLSLAERAAEFSSINDTLDSRFESFILDIERTMNEHLRAFERLSGRWDILLNESGAAQSAAEQFLADFSGLDAVIWVPFEGEPIEFYGISINNYDPYMTYDSEFLNRIHDVESVDSYVGLFNSDGRSHAVYAFSVETIDRGRIGSLVYYYRVEDLFKTKRDDYLLSYQLIASYQGAEIFTDNKGEHLDEAPVLVKEAFLLIDGMRIELQLNIFAKQVSSMYTQSFTLLLIIGSLLSLIIGVSVYHFTSNSAKRARQAIRDSKMIGRLTNRLKAAAEGANLGFWEYEPSSHTITWDTTCANLIGLDHIANGRGSVDTWSSKFFEADRINFQASLDGMNLRKASLFQLCMVKDKVGRVRQLKIVGFDQLENFGAIVGVLYDVTEEVKQKKRDRELTEELKRSNYELENFARIASHDLQEPLRKVRAFGQRVMSQESESMQEKSRDYLNRMMSAADRMSQLIHDLLSFSRLSSNKRKFELIDLNDLLKEILDDLETNIESSHAQIEVDTFPFIEGDRTQLRQLFQNLVGNAIKYRKLDVTPVIKISGSTHRDSIGSEMIDITITDNGIGFEQQYADQIFEFFKRLHSLSEYPGTGIGLSICKRIVSNHGGYIRATSQLSVGSSFYLSLPRRAAPCGH